MTSRRNFLAFATGGLAAWFLRPTRLSAETPCDLPENIIHTELNPGRWTDKVASHVPVLRTLKESGMAQVAVSVNHPSTPTHYIVKLMMVDRTGKVCGEKVLTPADKPEATFDAPSGYKGKLYILSFCNQHDLWMATTAV